MTHARRYAPLAAAALLAAAWPPLPAAAAPAAPAAARSTAQTAGQLPLGTFEQSQVGKPPQGWKARGGDIEKVYVVKADGARKYVHADARDVSIQIGREQEYDLKRYPVLTWRWRVQELPKGGDERKKDTGDSAAGVYVVFGGWPIPKTVKYVWSSTLPAGTTLESPFAGQTKIVVLRSGPEKRGQWIEERVNVLEDYRKLFGEDPDKARGIGILSDSDNTKSRAAADYDGIVALASAPSVTGGASSQARAGVSSAASPATPER